MKLKILKGLVVLTAVLMFSGCATLEKAKNVDRYRSENAILKKKLEKLKKEKEEELGRLNSENQLKIDSVIATKDKQLSDLENAKLELEKKFQKLIADYQVKLSMTERGLVITFLSEIFFESGKDKIAAEGESVLRQVAKVLNDKVPGLLVAVEGHTDNDPIRASGWKSNWELSSARSLAVVHFLINQCSVSPEKLSANAYGEYRPVKPNNSVEGRRENRRVEIVILPKNIKK